MFQVLCPSCRTNVVPAPSWDFSQTSVAVEPCLRCFEDFGLVSVQVRVSQLAALALPESQLRHRDGFVEFSAHDAPSGHS